MVTRLAVGAPRLELPDPVAPIAPEPLVPDVSAPVNATTVIDATTFWDNVAVTEAALSGLLR